MKIFKKIVILLMFPLILTFCSSDVDFHQITPHGKPYPISFSKGKVIKLDIIVKGSCILEKIEDPDYIFVSFTNGSGDKEILKYDLSLVLKDRFIIKRGQGPKEAMNPYILGGSIKEIICYDTSYKRIMFWNSIFTDCIIEKRNLWYGDVSSHSLYYSPQLESILFLLEEANSSPTAKSTVTLVLKNVKNKEVPDFKIYEMKHQFRRLGSNGRLNFWLSMPLHAFLLKRNVFLINLKDYIIYKYDLKGNLLKKVAVKFSNISFSKAELRQWLEKSFPYKERIPYLHFPEELWPACWLLPLGNGIAVGRRKDYKSSDIEWINADYFDLNLQYLGRIKLPFFNNWNDPMQGQDSVDQGVLVKGDQVFYIINDKENEDIIIRKWTWRNEKR